MDFDGDQLLRRTRAFYESLPAAAFTSETFTELGRASGVKPFEQLSVPLKRTLLSLLSVYHGKEAQIQDFEKAIAEAEEKQRREAEAQETSTEAETAEASSEAEESAEEKTTTATDENPSEAETTTSAQT